MLHTVFVQAGALDCMRHAGFHHLRPAREPGVLQREARVNQLKRAEMADFYRKKKEEQNKSLKDVLPPKAAVACK